MGNAVGTVGCASSNVVGIKVLEIVVGGHVSDDTCHPAAKNIVSINADGQRQVPKRSVALAFCAEGATVLSQP